MSTTAELRQGNIAFQANLYESQNPVRRWLHNTRREWVMHMFEKIAPPQANFLEIGIGCGIYTVAMAKHGNVTAVDINQDFVDAASAIPRVSATRADIMTHKFFPTHDIAVCSEVIEHIPDSLTALRNIRTGIKPNGYLILTTPNSYSTMELFARLLSIKWVVRLARAIYGESVDDLGHINRMTRGQLQAQIKEAGFIVVNRTDRGLYIPILAEFGGVTGARISHWLARRFRRSPILSNLLWTQCWLLQRPR
ncbi:MAG: hypothetical protein COW70_10880 [Hydrogenophilales bacterium CG18_big_fil_WC_8_21_14_2_50_58_12]|nr:MAG: hypothetical protein COW70_10880 [Hydrogenophilales bacterium CG18_big_fil_WC_8_21_14_2_50_58_12]